jgi:Rieske Fe-S protein
VPGYKQTEGSAKFDAEDDVYCPCHQSVYDPFTIVQTLFTARPRPDD